MATEQQGRDITMKAAADLSTKQYCLVYITAARTVNFCSGVAVQPLGILQNKPAAAGRDAAVRISGLSKCVCGTGLSAGAKVTTDTAGKAIAAAPGSGVNNGVVGTALDDADANDIFTVNVHPFTMQGA